MSARACRANARLRRGLAAAILFLVSGAPARGADRVVHLLVPPVLAPGAAAMPHIADPADEAERGINAALRRLDTNLRKAIKGCVLDDGNPGSWTRTVAATMRGPGFLSFAVTDETYCGGAHPDAGLVSIVYDLRTGAPVDWTRLLLTHLTGTLALQEGSDGTKMVTLASARLYALYLAGYGASGATAEEQAECKDTVRDAGAPGPPAMMVWLDAAQGGLAMQFDLPHAVEACAEAVVIPTAALAKEGADPRLVAALRAAHPSR